MARADLRVQLEYLQARVAASRRWSGPDEVRSQAWAELTADIAVGLGDVLALLAEEHERSAELLARLEELVEQAERSGTRPRPSLLQRLARRLSATARRERPPPG